MAERSAGEAREAPTPRRMREARARGQVARSAEVTAAAGFAGAAGVLLWAGHAGVARLAGVMRHGLAAAVAPEPAARAQALGLDALDTALALSLPLAVAAAALAAAAGYAHVGAVFATEPWTPDLARLSPGEGIRRLASGRTWLALAASLAKIGAVGAVAAELLLRHAGDAARLAGAPPAQVLACVAELGGGLLLRVVMLYAAVGVADLLWQRWVHHGRLMMTRREVERERKEQHGDPRHTAERGRMRRELAPHPISDAVRGADAVIVGSSQRAVAIRYDASTMSAPRVVATGTRLVAARIREAARQLGVPVYHDESLARALRGVGPGRAIPASLYGPVAELLRVVYARRGHAAGGPEAGSMRGDGGAR